MILNILHENVKTCGPTSIVNLTGANKFLM